MKTKVLSIITSLALILSMLPVSYAAAVPGELDLCDGSIVITETGYTQGGGEEVPYTGTYRLTQRTPVPTANTISVLSGTQTIVVAGSISIDVYSKNDTCAFAVADGANVNLQLEQDMTLKSGSNRAGLEIAPTAELAISATKETGYLMAERGISGVGIGGGEYGDGTGTKGQIILAGTASIESASDGGAGIGAGYSGHSSYTPAGTGAGGLISIGEQAFVQASSNSGAGIGGTGLGGYPNSYPTGDGGIIRIGGQSKVTASSKSNVGIGSYSSSDSSITHQVLFTDQAEVRAISTGSNAIGVVDCWYPSLTLMVEQKPTVTAETRKLGTAAAIGARVFQGTINLFGGNVRAIVTAAPSYHGYAIGGYDSGNGIMNLAGSHLHATGYYGVGHAHRLACYSGSALIEGGIYCDFDSSVRGNAWLADDTTDSSNRFVSGVLMNKAQGHIYGQPLGGAVTYTLPEDKEIPAGYTLTVDKGQQLIVPDGMTLTVNGTLHIEGELIENGTVVTGESGSITGVSHQRVLTSVVGTPATCSKAGVISHWHCNG